MGGIKGKSENVIKEKTRLGALRRALVVGRK
jgi:hypothetical protein